jgi:uncharacterized protein (DUF488 family)
MHTLSTIGYEASTVPDFLRALAEADIQLLIDVRAVAASRRPGFAKTRLAANLAEVSIDYIHMRGLGTPSDGRAAAKAGRHAEMRSIFMQHLATPDAQAVLHDLADLIRTGRRICILCFEADPAHCHRSMIADALAERMPLEVQHLHPEHDPD